MNLYLIPVEYKYGGGFSLLVKANNIDEAREKAKKYKKPERYQQECLSDETDYGDINKFDQAVISYYE